MWGRRIFSICCLFAGVILILYPRIREVLNRYETSSQAEAYRSRVDSQDNSGLEDMWNEAVRYNCSVSGSAAVLTDPFVSGQEQDASAYEAVLSVGENGLMGFVEIPEIDIYLPIYHGTDASVLEKGIGHLKGSSLPTGGEGTHAVLAGHTGLRQAKLFTDLDRLEEGDIFRLHILDRAFTYKIREITVVLPSDVSSLMVRPGEDLCTLVTCTPYGINSHRLLVTGERTENISDDGNRTDREGKDDITGRDRFRKRMVWMTGLALGLALILYPVFSGMRFRQQSERYIAAQKQRPEEGEGMGKQPGTGKEEWGDFREEADSYNMSLLQDGQTGIGDPAEVQKLPLLAAETEKYGLGFVEIPAMNVRLPVFFGASDSHLSLGSAVLEGTSLPLGEGTSNTVLAGHRGYRGIPYFREIECLEEGDAVYLTTLWDSYLYRVAETRIISPSDTEALEIQPGKNLLTLLTCHPYLSGGKYRYVVYCERDFSRTGAEDYGEEKERERSIFPEWENSPDSRKLIFGEKVCRVLGSAGIVILLLVQIRRERRSVDEK